MFDEESFKIESNANNEIYLELLVDALFRYAQSYLNVAVWMLIKCDQRFEDSGWIIRDHHATNQNK